MIKEYIYWLTLVFAMIGSITACTIIISSEDVVVRPVIDGTLENSDK